MQSKKRILLISYDDSLLFTRSRVLEMAGYEIVSVNSLPEGLAACTAQPFDMLVIGQTPSNQEKHSIVVEYRRRWKGPVLVMHRANAAPTAEADYNLDASEGPAALVEFVRKIFADTAREAGLQGKFLAVVDGSRKYIEVTDDVCELVGYSREELLRMTIDALTHPSVTNTPELFEQYVRDGFQVGQYVLRHRTGAPVPIRYRAKILPGGKFAAEWSPIP